MPSQYYLYRAGRTVAAVFLLVLFVVASPARAQQEAAPSVLIVTAHPDDDAMFAATVYRITHELHGAVDLALVTDGSGGFRYSELAEPIYGIDLTNEAVARTHLPAIRKRELMAGGRIVGIRNYFFLDALDDAYTENIDTVLQSVWDADDVRMRLQQIMDRTDYDFVFVHLPIPHFHAHHKAATILALEAARAVAADHRPVVLGSFVGSRTDSTYSFSYIEHDGYPITRVVNADEPFIVDRLASFGPNNRLNYQIVVNWLIAEHKSQGTMQLLMNAGDLERFWVFETNPPNALARAAALFDRLGRGRREP